MYVYVQYFFHGPIGASVSASASVSVRASASVRVVRSLNRRYAKPTRDSDSHSKGPTTGDRPRQRRSSGTRAGTCPSRSPRPRRSRRRAVFGSWRRRSAWRRMSFGPSRGRAGLGSVVRGRVRVCGVVWMVVDGGVVAAREMDRHHVISSISISTEQNEERQRTGTDVRCRSGTCQRRRRRRRRG